MAKFPEQRFYSALERDDAAGVAAILAASPPPAKDLPRLLKEAVRESTLDVVKAIWAHGRFEGDPDSGTPLHWAAMGPGKVDMVEFFLAEGLAIDAQDRNWASPLDDALTFVHAQPEAIALITGGATLTASKGARPVLNRLAAKNDFTLARAALTRAHLPADVDAQDHRGHTALHEACKYGHLAMATLLLECGADPARPAPDGDTPLHLAAMVTPETEAAQADLTALLLLLAAKGADLGAISTAEFTPLHAAAWKGTPATIEALLDMGANPAKLALFLTPPEIAVGYNQGPSVVVFLERGLYDPDRVGAKGVTGEQLAANCEAMEVYAALKARRELLAIERFTQAGTRTTPRL